MFDVANVCIQNFKEVSLSRRTVARRIEVFGKELTLQLKRLVSSFQLFSLVLNESKNKDVLHSCSSLYISESFEISEELLYMESKTSGNIFSNV